MQYMGGKSRIAGPIADIINEIPRRKIQNCIPNSGYSVSKGGGPLLCQPVLWLLCR